MTDQHPITPPPELVEQWLSEHYGAVSVVPGTAISYVATEGARWGADQELQACCLLLDDGEHAASYGCHNGTSLRAARRPKPPSLKEQALELVRKIEGTGSPWALSELGVVRRALEALDD
jgi:predicted HD phosphohydrolase